MRASTESAGGATVVVDETPSYSRRLAWAVVVAVGCAFSYSIGRQQGASAGLREADERLTQVNSFLVKSYRVRPPANDPPEAYGYGSL